MTTNQKQGTLTSSAASSSQRKQQGTLHNKKRKTSTKYENVESGVDSSLLKRSKRSRKQLHLSKEKVESTVGTRTLAKHNHRHNTKNETKSSISTTTAMSSNTTYSVGGFNGSGAIRRIRTPHKHDVLSGRGGGINMHEGNIQFRAWVALRKNDYNLATNKHQKAQVAKEVIDLVKNQDPPGRFLQRDPTMASVSSSSTSGWWVEIDDEKRMMAKTSQALREGAPQIRAAHKDELEENQTKYRSNANRRTTRKRKASVDESIGSTTTTGSNASAADAQANSSLKNKETKCSTQEEQEQETSTERAASSSPASCVLKTDKGPHKEPRHAHHHEDGHHNETDKKQQEEDVEEVRPEKRVRVDYKGQSVRPTDDTPPLLSMAGPEAAATTGTDESLIDPPAVVHAMPPLVLPPSVPHVQSVNSTNQNGSLVRSHSLALSDFSVGEFTNEEFVNPFEDESDLEIRQNNSVGTNFNWSHSILPPARVQRDVSVASSHGDLGGIGALLRQTSNNNNQATTWTGETNMYNFIADNNVVSNTSQTNKNNNNFTPSAGVRARNSAFTNTVTGNHNWITTNTTTSNSSNSRYDEDFLLLDAYSYWEKKNLLPLQKNDELELPPLPSTIVTPFDEWWDVDGGLAPVPIFAVSP